MKYVDKPWLKHYPGDVPHEVDVRSVPAYRLVDEAVVRYAQQTALIYYGTKISYMKLGYFIEKTASALHKQGVKKGSVVALYLPNCPQFIMAYYAVQKLGGIPTVVNLLYSPREIKLQLADSGADTVVMMDLLYNKTKPTLKELGINRVILTDIMHYMPYFKKNLARILRRMPSANISKDEQVPYFEEIIRRDNTDYPSAEIDSKEDVATIIYTSGTTGTPKGVSITHRNLVATMTQVKAISGDVFEEGKYLLAYLPFFHTYGQGVAMTGALSMGQILILILRPKFDELLKYIEKYRIGLLLGVPAFYRILIKLIKNGKYDLSSLKICGCGSDYLPQSLKDEWQELTGAEISEGYGLTEASGTGVPIGGKGKTGSVGIPMPSSMVAIADPDTDRFKRVGAKGEIVITGPQVMKGYWNGHKYADPFAEIAGEKWLRTGDIGYMDRDGYFYMVERKKNIIKYKAHAIYPGEVETIINQYEPVQEAAVIGIPANDPEFGQFVKAFVVVKDEYKGNTSRDDIIAYCKDKLAIYKIPKKIEFIDELPKNALGKVKRKELRKK